MSTWFWMNKVDRIGINQGTLLVWILNSYCFDHGDVTWDCSKGESFGKTKELIKYKVLGRVGSTIDIY